MESIADFCERVHAYRGTTKAKEEFLGRFQREAQELSLCFWAYQGLRESPAQVNAGREALKSFLAQVKSGAQVTGIIQWLEAMFDSSCDVQIRKVARGMFELVNYGSSHGYLSLAALAKSNGSSKYDQSGGGRKHRHGKCVGNY